ncbi:hypothetical protein BGX29_008556 [Mortierella sp. GBA35]|nr:hypothetical protein BGX29_008556 [Mortierella sp. GBA35]
MGTAGMSDSLERFKRMFAGDGGPVSESSSDGSAPRRGRDDEWGYSDSDDWEFLDMLKGKRKNTTDYQERLAKKRHFKKTNDNGPVAQEFFRLEKARVLKEKKEDKVALGAWKAAKVERVRRDKEYNIQVQQHICQQLRRLVKLRGLTLEGSKIKEVDDEGDDWKVDCLHLTLKTGLDYLRPLQANLEKLVVYRLNEKLCGGAEVEWIAQNLVHHADPVWQHRFKVWDRVTHFTRADEGENMYFKPSPKFKELIGVSVRGGEGGFSADSAAGNIAWIEYYCPQLVVVKNVVDEIRCSSQPGQDDSNSYSDSESFYNFDSDDYDPAYYYFDY